MKKVLVTGSNGMLGYAVSNYFKTHNYSVKTISRDEYDIAKDSFDLFIDNAKDVDVVINCAGVIKPRIKDMSVEDVVKVNSIFPKNLAMYCEQRNIECYHITTDCVYSGSKGNYDEADLFDADDLYGMSKNAGEPENCMVLRTSIIGEELREGRSLLEWALSQAGKDVKGFTNHEWNGVTTVYLSEVIKKIMEDNLYQKDLFHIHSPNTVTKDVLLEVFDKAYNLNLKIEPVEAGVYCNRSMSSRKGLTDKICRKTIEQQVTEMKSFFESIN